jgi:hypothetical protein
VLRGGEAGVASSIKPHDATEGLGDGAAQRCKSPVPAKPGVPVWLHQSVSFARLPMFLEQPSYLDQAALDFPELKLITGHGGWPWTA